jgi:hypothetical protein
MVAKLGSLQHHILAKKACTLCTNTPITAEKVTAGAKGAAPTQLMWWDPNKIQCIQ